MAARFNGDLKLFFDLMLDIAHVHRSDITALMQSVWRFHGTEIISIELGRKCGHVIKL
jgi:hypothetical protein